MKKTTFRKMTALILALTFMVAFIPSFTANAATNNNNTAQIIFNGSLYDTHKELCDRIAEGMNNLEDEIYVGDFNFNPSDLAYIMKTVIRTHPELFFVNSKQFAAGSNGRGIDIIVPFYKSSKDEIEIQRKKFDARVNEILSLADDNMTDLEKALVFHDEIALNCTYVSDDPMGIRNVTAYDSLVEGKANCQGYTEAYSYLLLLSGITTEIVESSAMVHVWNNVCIDGEYYNVDVTWDDPLPNKEGHVDHKYFMLSDRAIVANGNYGFAYEFCPCNSTKYDNAAFHNIDTKFCRIGNDFYVIDNAATSDTKNTLLKFDPETGAKTVIENFNYRWMASETSYYRNGFMSLEEYEDMLYFNSPDGVYSYNVNTREMTAVDIEQKLAGQGTRTSAGNSYYGIVVRNGEIFVATANTPNEEYQLQLAGKCVEAPVGIGLSRTMTFANVKTNILFGDIDFDGKIRVTDATMIQKYAAEMETFNEAQFAAADVNGDGRVNIVDSTAIQKFIVGLE